MPGETADVLDEQALKSLHGRAFRNRGVLKGRCGCFHCLSAIPAPPIAQWTDDGETALCPVCGIDSVLPEVNADVAVLEQMHERWFSPAGSVRIASQAEWGHLLAARTLPP